MPRAIEFFDLADKRRWAVGTAMHMHYESSLGVIQGKSVSLSSPKTRCPSGDEYRLLPTPL